MNKSTLDKKVSELTVKELVEAIMLEVRKEIAKPKPVFIRSEACFLPLTSRITRYSDKDSEQEELN